ncbi:MAG: hypothetical protein IKB79_05510 [Oscillospiraceae bacterium]|nr:hypothetical protein [Oscillospiraceae bacterium]
MKNKTTQYVVWIIGTVLLCGVAFALAITKVLNVQSGLILFGLYWLWNGLLLIPDRHPEFRKWDRWEKRAYGLALAGLGGLWTVMSFTPLSRQWIPCILSIVPPALIALVGRYWYVEKKRNEEYYKNQTEKD